MWVVILMCLSVCLSVLCVLCCMCIVCMCVCACVVCMCMFVVCLYVYVCVVCVCMCVMCARVLCMCVCLCVLVCIVCAHVLCVSVCVLCMCVCVCVRACVFCVRVYCDLNFRVQFCHRSFSNPCQCMTELYSPIVRQIYCTFWMGESLAICNNVPISNEWSNTYIELWNLLWPCSVNCIFQWLIDQYINATSCTECTTALCGIWTKEVLLNGE